MKILIYTDVHCSRTSSILPLYTQNSIYTTRLDMIIKSFKWMYSIARSNNIDLIINLGDLFDKNIVKSEELTAISECYKLSDGIPEYHIVGNHELLDEDKKFYATSILKNYNFIKIFDQPMIIDNTFSVLPYMNSDNITFELLESLKNKILLSHIDIMGSSIRSGYDLTCGVDPEFLAMNFNYVFNGHIHKNGFVNTSNESTILNVGSMTSISFADSNTYIPGISIFDTNTSEYKFYENPECIIFRKYRIDSLQKLINIFNSLDKKFKYVFCIECPYDIRNDVSELIENTNLFCLKYQIKTIIDSKAQNLISQNNFDIRDSAISNIDDEFIEFVKCNTNLFKYPIDKIINLVKGDN